MVGGGKVGAGDKRGRRGGKGGENRCEKEAQKGGGSRGKRRWKYEGKRKWEQWGRGWGKKQERRWKQGEKKRREEEVMTVYGVELKGTITNSVHTDTQTHQSTLPQFKVFLGVVDLEVKWES